MTSGPEDYEDFDWSCLAEQDVAVDSAGHCGTSPATEVENGGTDLVPPAGESHSDR